MKVPSNKVAKYMLFVGIAGYIILCMVAGLLQPDYWNMVWFALPVAALILIAGFIYTENIKKTKRKQFLVIRTISIFYIVGVALVILAKCFNWIHW